MSMPFTRAQARQKVELVPEGEADALAPVVALGGLLTTRWHELLYDRVLKIDKASKLPPSQRFVPPPQLGLGSVDYMRKSMTDTLQRLYDRLGERRMFLVGHSLGALMATMATLDTPEIVAGVMCLGGAHEGIQKETLHCFALRMAVGNPPEAQLLRHDSGFMREHTGRIAAEWPADVPVHVASTMHDELIVPPQGFGIRPAGHAPEMRLVVSNFPGAAYLAHCALADMPEGVQPLYAKGYVEHINLPLSQTIINYIVASRNQLPEAPAPLTQTAA